jgi:predicted ATPase
VTTTPTRPLTRVHLGLYRSLLDVTLEPGGVTVLIGPNSAGKSNLLSFFQLLSVLPRGGLRRFVAERGGMSTLLYYGPKVTSAFSFRLVFEAEGSSTTYAANIGHAAGDNPYFYVETVSHRDSMGLSQHAIPNDSTKESGFSAVDAHWNHPAPEAVSRWLRRIGFYHFHDTSITSVLRQNSPGSSDASLESDGRNLSAFLYRLMRSSETGDRAAWRRINLLVRRIAPAVEALMPEPVSPGDDEVAPRHVRLRWRDDRGEMFGVEALSDGTLRAIALITALAQPIHTLPTFISIDEPELGLHPAALALIAGLIRSASSHCQIVLATQSPALLDHFSAEEVVVVERADGGTTLRRLDPEQLKAWLAEYSLSELYDKNVLGGRP